MTYFGRIYDTVLRGSQEQAALGPSYLRKKIKLSLRPSVILLPPKRCRSSLVAPMRTHKSLD